MVRFEDLTFAYDGAAHPVLAIIAFWPLDHSIF